MDLLKQQIEALIFCSEQSISLDEIAASLKISFDWDLEDAMILEAIEELRQKYSADEFAFELVEISEGFQFLTKKEFHPAVSALIQHKAKKKLSVSQMETLAIIAYRQPISKGEAEHIRGVSCDYAMQKLLEKELIEISGKSDGPGRPILYSTSRSFMDYFGIKSVKDLPQLKDLHMEQNEIGIPSEDTGYEETTIDEVPMINKEEIIFNEEETITDYSETTLVAEEFIENSAEVLSPEEFLADANEPQAVILADNNDIDLEAEEKITADLLDRKSIYLQNEKKLAEEENPAADSEDFS